MNGVAQTDLWGRAVTAEDIEARHRARRDDERLALERERFGGFRCHGFAAPPGSGPKGETCSSCANCYVRGGTRKTFYKCRLVKPTHGPGTDIAKRAPACNRWEVKA